MWDTTATPPGPPGEVAWRSAPTPRYSLEADEGGKRAWVKPTIVGVTRPGSSSSILVACRSPHARHAIDGC